MESEEGVPTSDRTPQRFIRAQRELQYCPGTLRSGTRVPKVNNLVLLLT